MTGFVKRVIQEKRYGFIRATVREEYFFHMEDYVGEWEDLVAACNDGTNRKVEVEFEPANTDRGLRARNVRRIGEGK